jgi:eukaryotic-like serine/threonine-protein kinase
LTPPALEHVVLRALAKCPDDRWQSASDIAGELRWIAGATSQASIGTPRSKSIFWKRLAPWALLAVTLIMLGYIFMRPSGIRTAPLIRTSIPAPEDGTFALYGDYGSQPLLSPDGRRLAFSAVVKNTQAIYVRDLDADSAKLVPGSEGGTFPFWAPDSRQLGYFAKGKMVRADLETGTSFPIIAATMPRGASWGADRTIVYSPTFRSGIYAISLDGGEPRPLTEPDPTQHTSHRWPIFLPDGKHFLFVAANHRAPSSAQNAVFISSVEGGAPKRLVSTLGNAVVAGNQLFFSRDSSLFAQIFDQRTMELRGQPQLVVSSVLTDPSTWRTMFSVSASGMLVYAPGSQSFGSELVWFNRQGKRTGRFGAIRDYLVVSLSRNGRKLAAEVAENGNNIWVGDVPNNAMTRITFDAAGARQPVLSPDGSFVAYATVGGSTVNVIMKPTNGLGAEQILVSDSVETVPNDWSSDGKYLLLQRGEIGREEYSMFAMQVTGERKLIPIVRAAHMQAYDGVFSPNMRWIAYTSAENGKEEIFVSPFNPNVDPKAASVKPVSRWQISTGGGLAHWSHDGREIFYISTDGKVMSVKVRATATSFDTSPPQELFPVSVRGITGLPYAVTPNGTFLINTGLQPSRSPLNVITDWRQLLKH